MNRLTAAIAALIFLASIVAANGLTSRYGMVPVGFGLTATAGTYAAGCAFVARDYVHELTARPRLWCAAVVALGAVLAYVLSSPQLAVASGVAFAVSESIDLIVFDRLRRAGFLVSSTSSNVAGAIVDTLVFVPLAGFALTWSSASGQVVGKLAVTGVVLIAWLLILGVLRKRRNAVPV